MQPQVLWERIVLLEAQVLVALEELQESWRQVQLQVQPQA
jgi:hypothetical protein